MMNCMKVMMSLIILLMVYWGTVAQAALFPNVDCHNTTTAMEQTICNDSELNVLDRKFGEKYRMVKKWLPLSEGEQLELQIEQKVNNEDFFS